MGYVGGGGGGGDLQGIAVAQGSPAVVRRTCGTVDQPTVWRPGQSTLTRGR